MIDILIIGGGGAGLSCAIEAKKNCENVVVLSKTYPTSSQTSQAQGGINAVISPIDSIENYINDTLKSAHNIGDESTIKYMCDNSNDTIKWLDSIGVPFSRDEHNNIAQRKLGGASYPRACYSSDYTGLKIIHTLYDKCIKDDIKFLDEYMLLSLIIEDNEIKAVTALDIKNSEVKQILAKKVILATGGYAGIYSNHTTNSTATTGDGIAVALKAGITLANMEYVQFHPTALKYNSILISESARGEGGYLVTKDGKRFVDELLPRDIVARAIYSKIENDQEIFLDLRHLSKEHILKTMPQEYELVLQFTGLKLDEDLVPITPAAHYSMGGIKTSKDGKTNIKNLYAIGETSCNGVHGANRLGGNSLLEIITFGRLAAKDATCSMYNSTKDTTTKEYDSYTKDKKMVENLFNLPNKIDFYTEKERLSSILFKNVGLFRDEENLSQALREIENMLENIPNMGLGDKSRIYNTNLKEFIEFQNMLHIAKAIVVSALYREESRGAHYRVDFQEENMKYEKETLIRYIDNDLVLESI